MARPVLRVPLIAAATETDLAAVLERVGFASGRYQRANTPGLLLQHCDFRHIFIAENLRCNPAWRDAISQLPVSNLEFVDV